MTASVNQTAVYVDAWGLKEGDTAMSPIRTALGRGRHRAAATLVVSILALAAGAHALPAPELTHPPNQARLVAFHPHLDWEPVQDAHVYQVEVSRTADFREEVDHDSIHAVIDWYVIDKRLSPGLYHWRVRASVGGPAPGPWSRSSTFEIIEPATRITVQPGITCEQLQAAVQRAAANSPARIVFERGEYRFNAGTPDKIDEHVFFLRGARDLIFDFNGSTILLEDPADQFYEIHDCERITLCNFTFSRDPDTHANGTIRAVAPAVGMVEVEIQAGYHRGVFPRQVNQFFLWRTDPDEHKQLHPEGPPAVFLDQSRTEAVSPRRNRYFARDRHARHAMQRLAPGDFVQIEYRRWPYARLGHCRDVTVCNGGGAESFAMGLNGCSDVKVLHMRHTREHDLPSGGGFLVKNNTRGPWMEHCRFGMNGDDFHDVTANTVVVAEVLASTRLKIYHPDAFGAWAASDELIFYSPRSGLPIGRAQLQSIKRIPSERRTYEITISRAIEGIAPGKDIRKNSHVYNLSRQNRQFVHRHNECRYALRFGLNLKAIGALIEHNTFFRTGSCAVYLENEPSGYEGLVNRDVVIQHNTFDGCNFSNSARHHRRAVVHSKIIALERGNYAGDGSAWMGNRDLLVRHNTFLDWQNIAIRISSTDGARIEDNVIRSRPGTKFLWPKNQVYHLDHSRNVVIRRNDLRGERRPPDQFQVGRP